MLSDDQVSFRATEQGLPVDYLSTNSVGLQPVVFGMSNNGVVMEPSIKPIIAGPAENSPGPTEGGSIPIHTILADLHKDASVASDVKSNSLKGTEKSVSPQLSVRPVATADSAMSGEWARAMVFEIAGGEPGAGGPHSSHDESTTTSGDETTLQRREPLSSFEMQQQIEKLARRQVAAAQASNGRDGVASGQQQVGEADGRILAVAAPGDSSEGEATSADDGATIGTPLPDWTRHNAATSAFASAAVFDRLGDENRAIVESTFDRSAWLRSVGTTPLLMVLALERISAINSRRATRESRIAAAKKSLRLPR